MVWVLSTEQVSNLKQNAQNVTGISASLQSLLFFFCVREGAAGRDPFERPWYSKELYHYPKSLTTRRGRGASTVKQGSVFFQRCMKRESRHSRQTNPKFDNSRSVHSRKMEKASYMSIELPEVSGIFNTLQEQAIICRFNGFWPKLEGLSEWIYLNWTRDYDIYLCTKCFFVVQFDPQKDYNHVITDRPWFWGRLSLFVTPWFLGFDANSMVVSKMLI